MTSYEHKKALNQLRAEESCTLTPQLSNERRYTWAEAAWWYHQNRYVQYA